MTRINLIRARIAQPERRATEWLPGRWLAAITAIIVLHWLANAWLASAVELRDALRRDVDDLEQTVVRLRSNSLRDHADPVGDPSPAAFRLRSVAASMPTDLWLVGYREHQGQATMRGVSLNDEATRTFVESLSAKRVFGDIEITETTRTAASSANSSAPTLYEFQLRGVLREPVPAAAPGATSAG